MRVRLENGKLFFTRNPAFRLIASVKFAIPALLVFVAAMTYGTLVESLHGAVYAKRAVYQTTWYSFIQVAILASVVAAVLDRVPLRRRLVGFYLVHAALVILMVGATVTRYLGIDGTVELTSKREARQIRLDQDLLYAQIGKRQSVLALPEVNTPIEPGLGLSLGDGISLRVLKYLPFAAEKAEWRKADSGSWYSEWKLSGPRGNQVLKLGTSDQLGYARQAELGPLKVELVPLAFIEGFRAAIERGARDRYLLVDDKAGVAAALGALGASPLQVSIGNRRVSIGQVKNDRLGLEFFRVTEGTKAMDFFPRFSVHPVTGHGEAETTSTLLLYEVSSLTGIGPAVYLSRDAEGGIRFALGKGKEWQFGKYENTPVKLPWMGFELALSGDHAGQEPLTVFEPALPHGSDENEPAKAAWVEVRSGELSETFWVSNQAPARAQFTGAELFVGGKLIDLPFSMKLERFKMDRVPGTDKPASYESFVEITGSPDVPSGKAHIYMNHPLKAAGYTFYQSSFLQDDEGAYHSILSVNRDPGRVVKYAGALLLVLGLILHFLILHNVIRVKP